MLTLLKSKQKPYNKFLKFDQLDGNYIIARCNSKKFLKVTQIEDSQIKWVYKYDDTLL